MCLWISTPVKSLGFKVGYRESAAGASALCRTVIDRVAGCAAAYNNTGRSGLAGYTPNQVADSRWDQTYQRCCAARRYYDQAHPSRVPARPVAVGTVPDRVELVVYSTKGAYGDGKELVSLLVR